MKTDRLVDLEGDLIEMIQLEVTAGKAVTPQTDLLLTGLVSSISVVRIVTWLEEHLDIEIDPVDVVLENFQTVELMVDYARRR